MILTRCEKKTSLHTINFLMGILVFSPVSSLISIDVLHLPISFPELLFIPFINYFFKEWWPKKFPAKMFFGLVLLWIWLLTTSIIIGEYSLKSIFGCARTYLYIFFFLSIFYGNKHFEYIKIYTLSCGTLAGWMIDAVYRLSHLLSDGYSMSYGPMIALPIFICFPILNSNIKRGYFNLSIAIFIGVIGLLRRVILIALVDYLICKIWTSFKIRAQLKSFLYSCIIILIICVSGYPLFRQAIKDYNHDMYVRIIEKSESIVSGEGNEGDDGRHSMRKEFFKTIDNYWFPKGFVSKSYMIDGDGSFNDFPLKEIAHSFGLLFIITIFLIYTLKIFNIYKKIKGRKISLNNFVLCMGYLTILVLLGLEGSFITYPYQSIYTGFFLGSILKRF